MAKWGDPTRFHSWRLCNPVRSWSLDGGNAGCDWLSGGQKPRREFLGGRSDLFRHATTAAKAVREAQGKRLKEVR